MRINTPLEDFTYGIWWLAIIFIIFFLFKVAC